MWLYDCAAKLPDGETARISVPKLCPPDPWRRIRTTTRMALGLPINGLGKAKLPDTTRVKRCLELLSVGANRCIALMWELLVRVPGGLSATLTYSGYVRVCPSYERNSVSFWLTKWHVARVWRGRLPTTLTKGGVMANSQWRSIAGIVFIVTKARGSSSVRSCAVANGTVRTQVEARRWLKLLLPRA